MRLVRRTRTGARTLVDLLVSVWRGPNWWLVPVVLLLIPVALVLVFLQTVPLVAPFTYTVF